MIRLDNVSKSFRLRNGQVKEVARNVSITFPRGKMIALLGRNGAGKSTLLRMISGALEPDRGRVTVEGTLSWPVGFGGSFHRDLTGAQNIRFLARVYGVDTDELLEFVRDFSELGKQFHEPFHTYSSGMRSRLAFGVSMGIHFDMYLMDEVTAVGDQAFRNKSEALLMDRMRSSGGIYITHSLSSVERVCQGMAVLEGGILTYFDDMKEGLAFHQENMRRRSDA